MIQRVQTIFLVLVGICMLVILIVPIWKREKPETKEKIELNATQMVYSKDGKSQPVKVTVIIAILAGIAGGIAFYSIFLFYNLVLQMKVVLFNTLILCAVLGMMVYYNYQADEIFLSDNESYQIGYFLPGVAIVANYFARLYIRKDYNLIRDSNRMR